ncbi:MAG: hypothetical protein COY66_01175 [Candidatus Kerfeldbacteria bacterium CG_4_10_14_0_8_um_filter_42_10]|uniref:Uncharacterized protein n=1 Tax=Candidatus Kerfeldbacteria bacterium CG_4_10_14_0_8_um_filter_42_10 TaxID=2014248 RepID=A0A2M7RKL5_9BACT|nr:MAG: hypothetical protein COY66_01175 [Candidatus Kerfeldbacteria bacterium CG_4_10_14_0_8_um_filter_42_10]
MFELKNEQTQVKAGVLAGLLESLYVLVVATIMMRMEEVMPNIDGIFGIVMFLTLLVFSVGVSGIFVFGLPIHLFLEKRVKDAVRVMTTTFLTLMGVFFITMLFAAIYFTQ